MTHRTRRPAWMLAWATAVTAGLIWTLVAVSVGTPSAAAAAADPLCLGHYGGAPGAAGAPLRFGVDPGIAGSAGGVQLPTVSDNPTRDLAALRALRPPGRVVVLRLNRLFWSDGQAGISRFGRMVTADTGAGFDVELQVRYHPAPGQAGDIAGWDAYVRHVVDSFGANPRVVAMTITNEVNIEFSPNTSDGFYSRARDALISGIEAAHREAVRRHFAQLRFGFTFAYRFVPTQDAAFFAYLSAHGGRAFRHALGFVGVDFYPGSIYPPVLLPGDSYRSELAQALGVMRDCFAPLAGISRRVPLWITENGVPTGALSETAQASALDQLVHAAVAYARADNVTDYRWFNLRDSVASSAATPVGATFSSDGLLRADYTRKPAFAVYRQLIAQLGR
jgi:hypothetical protein